jgi:nitrite reductase/ring-hydroxylating ferredoxin subunit
MTEFRTVARTGDIAEGGLRAFDVDGRPVAVAHLDGGWYAFSDVCTHRQCSLAEGELDGGEVECPCHGSRFDVATGEVRNGPATEPVEAFPVRAEGDEIQVAV